MTIEQEVFERWEFLPEQLLRCGFQPDGQKLSYSKPLPEAGLRILLTYDGGLKGRILDAETGEDYTLFRVESALGFSAEVRQQYKDLLLEIRARCCRNRNFRSEQGRRIADFIYAEFGGTPEFLWASFPTYAAFRREGSKKWYALIGTVARSKVDAASRSGETVEIINVKVEPNELAELLELRGYYPAYHMSKKSWTSIILDDTLPDEEIRARLRESYRSV